MEIRADLKTGLAMGGSSAQLFVWLSVAEKSLDLARVRLPWIAFAVFLCFAAEKGRAIATVSP